LLNKVIVRFTIERNKTGVKDIREVIDKAKQSGGLFTANLTGLMRFIVLVNRSKIHFGSTKRWYVD
jgi:hypothetical protein